MCREHSYAGFAWQRHCMTKSCETKNTMLSKMLGNWWRMSISRVQDQHLHSNTRTPPSYRLICTHHLVGIVEYSALFIMGCSINNTR
ncbi:predicted protein [Botrytis cinerea T4]|uniref:Uncharacterized protein n=1 Tax=Botryotinia fuckeliana (strain T4) TaxID=999810 RepID=G2Y0G0_BOTF4|nr:predicted protein [Botrytis cinerea T4]